MAEAVQRVTRRAERPTVVLTTTTAFAAHWLVPRLSSFRRAHPEIALSLLADDDVMDLDGGRADLAIRLYRQPPADPQVEVLQRDRVAPLASPTLGLSAPEDLARVPLIQFDWRRPWPTSPSWTAWFAAAGLDPLPTAPLLRFNEESHALQAAIGGQGVALFSLTIASDALRRGMLVRPFDPWIPGATYGLAQAKTPQRSSRIDVETVRAWLLEQARETRIEEEECALAAPAHPLGP